MYAMYLLYVRSYELVGMRYRYSTYEVLVRLVSRTYPHVPYAVMAPHRRIPWMAFLSFFYMCILSFTRGGGGGASVAGGTDALDIHV